MKIEWVIESGDVKNVKDFLGQRMEHPFVQDRIQEEPGRPEASDFEGAFLAGIWSRVC
jgi:hypothetical protein